MRRFRRPRYSFRRRRYRRRIHRTRRRRSRYESMKFIIPNIIDQYSTIENGLLIAPSVAQMPKVKEMLKFWREYRITGVALKYRTNIRHMYTSFQDGAKAGPRLAIVPAHSTTAYDGVKSADELKLSGRYREMSFHHNWCVVNRSVYIDGDGTRGPRRGPWLYKEDVKHSCFYCRPVNLTSEFKNAVKKVGQFDLFLYVQFRTRKTF